MELIMPSVIIVVPSDLENRSARNLSIETGMEEVME